ncbi:MAG: hypothetical protein IIC01_00700 [Planctomycetes bacterium]|nr:hypothetical protein [Planctomycetota bacterium]
MPLFPTLLAPFVAMPYGVVLAKIFHWFLGAGVAALAALLATDLFDRRVGWIAGLLVAFDPFLVFFSSLLLTETLFTGVLVGLWWIAWPIMRHGSSGDASSSQESKAESLSRKPMGHRFSTGETHGLQTRATLFGIGSNMAMRPWQFLAVAGALAIYVREAAAGLVVVLLCLIVVCRRFDRRVVGVALITGVFVYGAILPWSIRNAMVTGEMCRLTTRAGISLYDGVGPQATGASNLGPIKQMSEVRGLSETEWNRYFLRESFKAIKDDPMRIVRLAGVKLRRMWNPFPNVESYQSGATRLISAAWTLPVFALAALGAVALLVRRRENGWTLAALLLLPALYLSALHCVFVGSVRYRLGAMPMLEILAAYTLVEIVSWVRRRRRDTETVNAR